MSGSCSHTGATEGIPMTAYNFPAKATAKTAAALREQHAYDYNFWRAVPAAQWRIYAADELEWWSRTIGFARGLVKSGSITIDKRWTAAELNALWDLAVSGKRGIDVHYCTHQDAELAAWTARATTDALAIALAASCNLHSTDTLFAGFSAAQLRPIKRARMISDAQATDSASKSAAKVRRWYFIAADAVTVEEWAAIAPLSCEEMLAVPYGAKPDQFVAVRTNLQGVRASVHKWVEDNALARTYLFSYDSSETATALLLWAASLESVNDPFVAKAAAILEADRDSFRKGWVRERAAPRIANALLAAPDPKAVLAGLRGTTKSKAVIDLLEAAKKLLVTNLGLAGAGAVSWEAMDPDAGAELLESQDDVPKAIAGWLNNADGNAAVRIFLATAVFLIQKKNKGKLGTDEWKTVSAILRRIETTAGPDLPSEITRRNWGKQTMDEAFAWGYELLQRAFDGASTVNKPMSEDELAAAMKALHAASKNERFRGLLAGVLGESFAQKLVRLAAACANHKGGTVTRWFAERTEQAPGAKTINRLYGSPIGVSAKAWPMTKKKKPMQHILTLETRALSNEAQAQLGNTAAIAVFLADINEPYGEHAIVALSRADLALTGKPVREPDIEGVKLELHELRMPKAVYQGGKKTGPLKELRTALDHLDGVLSTDRTSPDWIQEPEPDGALIAQLDATFAPQLNFGDCGAIYIMTGGLVFQCS
jgi:hypothetical protein